VGNVTFSGHGRGRVFQASVKMVGCGGAGSHGKGRSPLKTQEALDSWPGELWAELEQGLT
jgi:hypothetical protein